MTEPKCTTCNDHKEYYVNIPSLGIKELINCEDCNSMQSKNGTKEMNDPNFTSQQIDWICYQIGKWYLQMKPLLEGQHNLGHMKEILKMMICPVYPKD
jgi:hypothetical protein